MSPEAYILVALWVALIRVEYKGKSVARRQDGLVSWVMAVSGILAAELSQDFFIMQDLWVR